MKLVYITGIDGCGKTTQSKILTTYLIENKISAQYQWLRWSPSIGRAISYLKRNNSESKPFTSVKDDISVQNRENELFSRWAGFKNRLFSYSVFRFLWLQYATWDYYFFYKKAVSNWLSDVVVLDRYYFDFIVDQSLNYDESPELFELRVKSGVLKNLRKPDVFILIDIDPSVGWERKRDGTSMDHLSKLSQVYGSLKLDRNIFVIDGNLSEDKVHAKIKNIINNEIIGESK